MDRLAKRKSPSEFFLLHTEPRKNLSANLLRYGNKNPVNFGRLRSMMKFREQLPYPRSDEKSHLLSDHLTATRLFDKNRLLTIGMQSDEGTIGAFVDFKTKSVVHQVFWMTGMSYGGNLVCVAPYVLINFDKPELFLGRFESEKNDFKLKPLQKYEMNLTTPDCQLSLGRHMASDLTSMYATVKISEEDCYNVVIKVETQSLRPSDQSFDHAIIESPPLSSIPTANLNDLAVAHSIVVACSNHTIFVMRKKDLTVKTSKKFQKCKI